MKNNVIKKLGVSVLTGMMMMSCTIPVLAANNTATIEDLADQDIIDITRKASLSIYKYDITSAEAAGVYQMGSHNATGEADVELEETMRKYAVEGVEFTYLHCGDIETYSYKGGSDIKVVYEIPDGLRNILNLETEDAVDMSAESVSSPCDHTGVYHYTSQQLNDSLKDILETDNIAAKDAMESYVTSSQDAIAMGLTDQSGYTHVEDLDVGLYLLVETKVPEEIVSSCNPWFASLPFTNESGNWNDTAGGQKWLYDMTCYPKNQTGNPTLDKLVRNAHGEAADTVGEYEDYSQLIYNKENSDVGVVTSSDQEYVETREEYKYASTGTASEGDNLDYILVSKLPHVTSKATYLTEYSFKDTLSKGLTYNKDVKIAFYHTAEDANKNNTANADAIWNADEFTQEYTNILVNDEKTGETTLTVDITDKGLAVINDPEHGYSDCYIVVYYTVKVNSDATVVLGDEGNPNDVVLTWRRTSDNYYNTLEDKCEVYSFGLNLTKTFSDNKGDMKKVQFKLYNTSDAYYVVAKQESNGLYYVTGKAKTKDEGTTFIPASDGKIMVYGIEGDVYQLTEIATDNGYSLLKDQITITINSTSETIIPSVAGTIGLEEATAQGQSINQNYAGGIVDATGVNVSESKGVQATDNANGRTIGKTAMYEGDKICATAIVDQMETVMSEVDGSANAKVDISIMNNKSFLLPQTGGKGLYVVTILGAATVAMGTVLMRKHKNEN